MDKFNLIKYISSKRLLKESKEDNLANKWNNLEDEMKLELLLSVFKDPDDASKYVEDKWEDLPPEVTSNIDLSQEHEGQEIDEIDKGGVNPGSIQFSKTAPDATKMKALLVKLAKFVQNWEKEEPNSFHRMMDIDLELEKYL